MTLHEFVSTFLFQKINFKKTTPTHVRMLHNHKDKFNFLYGLFMSVRHTH